MVPMMPNCQLFVLWRWHFVVELLLRKPFWRYSRTSFYFYFSKKNIFFSLYLKSSLIYSTCHFNCVEICLLFPYHQITNTVIIDSLTVITIFKKKKFAQTRTKKFQSQTKYFCNETKYFFVRYSFNVYWTRAELRITLPLLCDPLLYQVCSIHDSWETTAEYISHTSRPPVILPLQLPFYICT